MKKILIVTAVAAAGTLFQPAAMAQLALAQKDGCLACHSVDHKVMGPAYRDVAKKYAHVPGAEERLVKKVLNGGTGVWGHFVMPANKSHVSEADARKLVHWILSLK